VCSRARSLEAYHDLFIGWREWRGRGYCKTLSQYTKSNEFLSSVHDVKDMEGDECQRFGR
jgi:hypothetical protein